MTVTRSPLVAVHGPVIRHLRQTTTQHTVMTLAPAVGLTFSHLAKVERGEVQRVRPEVVAALARELNVADRRVLLADPYDPAGPQPAEPTAA